MLSLITSPLGRIGILVLAVGLAYGAGQWQGRTVASSNAKLAAAENTARILKERGQIDEDVSASDAAALCADFGLPDDQQAECVRRLREAGTVAGDVDLHSDE